MPALPHPLTLEDQLLARNRGRARRELWAQSLFIVALYAALGGFALLSWLGVDTTRVLAVVAAVERHQGALALLALVAAVLATRARLRADARRHLASAHAALPIWRDLQLGRDRRLRTQLVLRLVLGFALAVTLIAVHDGSAAWAAADALRWSLVAAFLAIVLAPAADARRLVSEGAQPRARAATVPRWLSALARPALPHLPQWWWQRSASLWLRGRAATAVGIGLLLAPAEAAAIVLPIVLLMLMALLNALDVAHRLAADIESALAARPPMPKLLLQALWPLHATLTLVAAAFLALILLVLQASWPLCVLVAIAVMLLSALDLRLAVLLRRDARRIRIARTQVLLVLAALASALPMLLPLAALALLVALERRLRAESTHA